MIHGNHYTEAVRVAATPTDNAYSGRTGTWSGKKNGLAGSKSGQSPLPDAGTGMGGGPVAHPRKPVHEKIPVCVRLRGKSNHDGVRVIPGGLPGVVVRLY